MKKLVVHKRRAYLCICHRPPVFSLPDYVNLVQTGDFSTDLPSLSVKEYLCSIGVNPPSSYLADYAYLLIRDALLKVRGEVDVVVTLQHRKICCTRPVGIPARNMSHSWLCPGIGINTHDELDLIKGDTLLACPHFYASGVMAMYAKTHVLQDYVKLSGLCLDSGVITDEECLAMAAEKVLFWCPGVGALPYEGALYLYDCASSYAMAIHQAGYVCAYPDHPYQKRAISFYAERLMSQKLMAWLKDTGRMQVTPTGELVMPNSIIGYLHNCSEGDQNTDFQQPGLY